MWGSRVWVRAQAQRTRRWFVLGAPGALVGGLVKTADIDQQKLPFGCRPLADIRLDSAISGEAG